MLSRCVSFSAVITAGVLLTFTPSIQAQRPLPVFATGFCSTGLTAQAPQPSGCLNSKIITPINPQSGGPIVDGNWELAEPFPSAPTSQPAPNPCTFSGSFKPVPVNAPYGGWYNPNDQLSQWIGPNGGGGTPEGWYIYRTGFAIPAAYPGYSHYELVINGKLLADDYISAVYLQGQAGVSCKQVASFSNRSQLSSWNKLKITIPVAPDSAGYLYFITYNAGTGPNPTGVRVEFTSPYLYPY